MQQATLQSLEDSQGIVVGGGVVFIGTHVLLTHACPLRHSPFELQKFLSVHFPCIHSWPFGH